MNSPISFINNDFSFSFRNKKRIREWIQFVTTSEKKQLGIINYVFCSDDYLSEINIKYLNANYLTDIITFDYTENNMISGDIMISMERVKENAKLYTTSLSNELHRVMIHGILHLCGLKDESEKEQIEMRKKEDYYLNKLVSF